jgi:hypothetical protein
MTIARPTISYNLIYAIVGIALIVLKTNCQSNLILKSALDFLAAICITYSITFEGTSSNHKLTDNNSKSIFNSFKLNMFCLEKMIGEHFHKEKPPSFWWFFFFYFLIR